MHIAASDATPPGISQKIGLKAAKVEYFENHLDLYDKNLAKKNEEKIS